MKQSEIDDLIKLIKTGDSASIESSIEKIRVDGNELMLNSIINEFNSFEPNIQKDITSVICDIHDQALVPVMVEHIKSVTDDKTKSMLLTAAWNSRLDFLEYMEIFIDLVIESDFGISFDAFTVIENSESKVTKERKAELVSYVKLKIGKCGDDTLVLAHDIVGIIERFEEL